MSDDTLCCRHLNLREQLVQIITLDLLNGVVFLVGEESNEPCREVEVIVDTICNEKPLLRFEPYDKTCEGEE